LTVSALDIVGNPVPNLPVSLQVFGANTQTLSGTTGLNGLATFSYVGLFTGADTVQASAFISGLREISNQAAVKWSPPGGAGSPSITNPSPADGATLTKPTPISATFSPPAGDSIASWSVSYQGVGLPAVQLAGGPGTPPTGTLATFDPTLFPNGAYVISITATAGAGGQQMVSSTVTVLGNLKLGRYVTTSQDLHAPVNGFQIQVLRSYDSLDKTQGDFGVGWRLSLANLRTSSNRVLGAGGWTQYNKSCVLGLCFTAFKNSAPRYVMVVFPDQHTEIFDFTPQGGTNIFWGCTPAFTARASVGTTSTLVPLDDTGCSYTGDGNLYGSGGGLYNPQRFQLTTINGTVLVLDRTLGLVSETDPNGNSLTVSAAGVISSSGPSIVFDRDVQGRITRIHGPSGELLQYIYSPAGDLQTYIDGNNNQISYTYDTAHNVKVITGPNGPIQTLGYVGGRVTSQINNDVAGQRQTVLDPNQKLTTIYTYDDLGDVIQLDRAFGSNTLTDRWTYDVTGHVVSYTDALGNPSSAVYDASGNLIKVTDATGNLFRYTYNSLGQVTSVIDPSQSTIQTYVYDSHGNRTQWNRADHSQFLYQYNAGGVVTQVTDPTGRVTKYAYDSNGHLAMITANGNNVTQVVCDASGRVTKVIDSNGKTTRYTYDGLGDLVSAVDDNNHQWLYTFDFQSQLIQIQDPLGNQRKFQYDAAGALSQVTDRDGRLIQFQYNADGQLARKTLPGNDVTTYTYDPVGQLIEAVNADSDVKFAFDAAGNITHTTSTGTAMSNQPTVTLSYTYDANGNKTSLTGPDGQTFFGYNVWSQLTSVKDPAGRPFTLSYDTSFRLTSIQRPNGVNDALTYDASDVLTGIGSTHSGTTIAALSYSLDPNGRAKSITDPSGTTNLTRDPLGQLTSAAYGSAAFPNDTFQYDGAGNRIANATGPSTYDSANHLLSGPGVTYQYDNEGDLTQMTDASGTTRFTFNAEHRLLSITHPDSTVTTFRYDPFGRRIEINDGGAVTRYAYDGNDIHVEYDGANNLIASYVDGTGTDFVLEMVRGGQPYYYLRDAVGSTTALVDGSGAVVNTYRYSAFGAQIVTGSVANPFTYAGREYDSKSGLYYYRDRWYDPRTGRFISEDPTPAVNLYPYAFNDPITYNDPFGAQALFEYQTRCAEDEEVFVYAGREEGGCYIGISNNFARRVGEHARAGVHVFTKVVQLSTRLGTQGLNRLGARGVEQKLIELLTKQGYNLTNKINSIAETSDAYPGAVGFGADLIQTLDLLAAVMAACLP
jgi:RHS repeat-associated protein